MPPTEPQKYPHLRLMRLWLGFAIGCRARRASRLRCILDATSGDWMHMDLIPHFLERYTREYDFYAEVGRLAATRLEVDLDAAGVRAIVTHRAKHPRRLEDKLRKRAPEKAYASVDQIYADIVDLAGVRVALYFPGDRELVGSVIRHDFQEMEPAREFPSSDHASDLKKFSGYAATHYRVRLQPGDPEEMQSRYSTVNIEIQVASVLMHAWAEVEHDLAYKPTQGDLSDRELALLDQLNGLVMAGEIALEQLQVAGRERVGESDRTFGSHYDLAAYIIERAETEHQLTNVSQEGLGRVDHLFEFLSALDRGTPKHIAPYLKQLHSDLERRPLAEQVIDALLAEDGGRYDLFAKIRDRRTSSSGPMAERRGFAEIGAFLSAWIRLETLLRDNLPDALRRPGHIPTGKSLSSLGWLDADESFDFDQLRRLRNIVVHGIEAPSEEALQDATVRVNSLIERVSEGLDGGTAHG